MKAPLDGRVAVVTGGGAGIGMASAVELARNGATVVVVDPGVGVQGEIKAEPSAAATAKLIRAEGGKAIFSTVSVADQRAVDELFNQVIRDLGSLDIVVNSAGILRRSTLSDSTEDDWNSVFDVHLHGYLNVLSAALPTMIDAGYGRIVGFTSGVGLARVSEDQTAYGCAKRAVAVLTWELASLLPKGINLNAIAPIADTRMIRDALARRPGGRTIDLNAAPQPEDIAPASAYFSGDRVEWCRGRVFSSPGSELSVIGRSSLLEAVKTEGIEDFGATLNSLVPVVFGPSELSQQSGGGGMSRIGDIFNSVGRGIELDPATNATCLVVSDDRSLATETTLALRSWGFGTIGVGSWEPFDANASNVPSGFEAAEQMLKRVTDLAEIDAVVVAMTTNSATAHKPAPDWLSMITSHRDVAQRVILHAAWTRAVSRYVGTKVRPIRLVHVSGAATSHGRTIGEAIVQLSRSANKSTSAQQMDTFSISVESDDQREHRAIAQLVGYLIGSKDGPMLKGAELVAGRGWVGLRSHPVPTFTVTFGGPTIPISVDTALRAALQSNSS